MRPSKTIKYVAALATNKVDLELIKLWVEIFGLVAVLLTFGCYVWLAFLQKDANEINSRAVEASQRGLDLNQKSLALAQESVELTQRSIDLTQKSLIASQEANEIAQKGLKVSSMPAVGIRITDVSVLSVEEEAARWSDRRYAKLAAMPNSDIEIQYLLTDYSDVPARKVFATCYLETVPYAIDRNGGLPDNPASIMPKEPLGYNTDLMVQGHANAVLKGINSGDVPVTIELIYSDEVGNTTEVLETFRKSNGAFAISDIQYDPDQATVMKLIDAIFPDVKKK